jgi:hypothetical protein
MRGAAAEISGCSSTRNSFSGCVSYGEAASLSARHSFFLQVSYARFNRTLLTICLPHVQVSYVLHACVDRACDPGVMVRVCVICRIGMPAAAATMVDRPSLRHAVWTTTPTLDFM